MWRDGGAPNSGQAGYDQWAANYGATSANPAVDAVPEPAAGLLLLTVLTSLGRKGRSR